MTATDHLSLVFGALADPTRRQILHRLEEGPATVGELGEPFSISQPAISKHLKVLERAGLISRSDRGTARLSVLEAESMREAAEYVERYRRFWNTRFDRLDEAIADYLESEGE